MVASLNEVLSTRVTTRVVRQTAGVNRYLLQLFGFQPGGFAERDQGHRQFGYDIFNDTRTVAMARGPAAPSGVVTRQKVGRVEGTFPRFREHLPLLSEEIHNLRVIGGPSNVYDQRGMQYISRQQRFMGQRIGNNRSLLMAGMMRGGHLYAHKNGDDVYYNFTSSGALWDIDWKMPAGNKDQLDMLGDGDIITAPWSNQTTDIPAHIRNINVALNVLNGTNLSLAVVSNNVWSAIVNNDHVQAQAGTSNPPFSTQQRVVGTDPGTGLPQTVIIGRIAAIPWLDFVITDEGLKVGQQGSEVFNKFIPDNYMWFGPNPSTDYFEMLLGDEPVNEGYNMVETLRMGAYAYTERTTDPTGYKLHTGDNCIPANYVPASNGYAQVIF